MRDAHLDNQFDGWGPSRLNFSTGLTSNPSLILVNSLQINSPYPDWDEFVWSRKNLKYVHLSHISEIKLANVLCLRRMKIILITNKQVLESRITFQVYKTNKKRNPFPEPKQTCKVAFGKRLLPWLSSLPGTSLSAVLQNYWDLSSKKNIKCLVSTSLQL